MTAAEQAPCHVPVASGCGGCASPGKVLSVLSVFYLSVGKNTMRVFSVQLFTPWLCSQPALVATGFQTHCSCLTADLWQPFPVTWDQWWMLCGLALPWFCSSSCVCHFPLLIFHVNVRIGTAQSTARRGLLNVIMVNKSHWCWALNYFQNFIYDQKSWSGSSCVKLKTLLAEKIPF